jgi:hypothetical protein
MKKTLARLGVIEILTDQFDGDPTLQLQVERFEHATHSTFAERALDPIP